jgi:Chaperone of endosialidase
MNVYSFEIKIASMKTFALLLLFASFASFGQSIEIRPDDNSLFNIKASNNQPFEVKKDSIFIQKSVLQFIPESFTDQSSFGGTAFLGYYHSIGQTFKAGKSGQMDGIRLRTTDAFSNVTLRIFKGTSASGTLLSTTIFNQLVGLNTYNLANQAQMIAGEMYFFDITPAMSIHFSQNVYLDGENNSPSILISSTYDIVFETLVKQETLTINCNTGDIKTGGYFEGNGSKLTNLKLVGDGSLITNLKLVGDGSQITNLNLVGDGSQITNIATNALSEVVTKQGNTFNGANQLLKLNSLGAINLGATQIQYPINIKAPPPNGAGFQDLLAFENNASAPRWHIDLAGGNDLNIAESGVANYHIYLKKGGNTGIGTNNPVQKLDVAGSVRGTSFVNASDLRFKRDFSSIENPLDKIQKINGMYYYWKKDAFKSFGFDDRKQVGFIAQDLEKIFPEVVITDSEGYKSVDYAKLTPLLVEALKELKKENSSLMNRLEKIENLLLQAKKEN